MKFEKPVCVTGASGFIAAHIVRELLDLGYRVRGTVRNPGAPGKHAFLASLPAASERLELVAADLIDPGSYDKAVEGCEILIHTASPYVLDAKDAQRDLVDPAVDGTLNVLRSARSAGVGRVVLTSSMAAITDEPLPGKVFSEEDWNERSTLSRNPYYLSKVLAERAAWTFAQKNPGFDLVVINPYMVIGPSLGPELNTSTAIIRDLLTGAFPGVLDLSWGFVDVRDVAHAHVLATENAQASGRYVCAGDETLSMKQVIEILRDAGYGERYRLPRLDLTSAAGTFIVRLASYTRPRGTGSYVRTHLGRVMRYDNSKIKRELGMQFRPARESVLATAEDLIRWRHADRPAAVSAG